MKNKILVLVIGVFIASCATQQQEPPRSAAPKATEKQAKEFREGLSLYRAHKTNEAQKKLIHFLQTNSPNDLVDDAYYFIGLIYFEQNDYFKAYRYWMAVVDGSFKSEYVDRSLLGAAQCQAQLGHTEEAMSLVNRYRIKNEPADAVLNGQALDLSGRLKLLKGQSVEALSDILRAQGYKKSPQEKQAELFKAEEIVKTGLNQKQLEEITDSKEFAAVEAVARFKLGTMYYEQKSWPASKAQFEIVRQKFPDTEYAMKAGQYTNFVDSQERIDPTTVGVILPLTGKYATQGYKVLRGIEMAAHVFDSKYSNTIKLAVIDSEGNPELAKRAVDRLVTEDHAAAIIGDIAAKTAQTVAMRAQELGVPCLTLSQKQGLTEIGDFIFRNNLTPDMQMKALVNYAMKVRGYKRFAIIYPNDAYGTEYATAFWDYVLLNGGQITGAQSYSPEETDFRQSVQRLVGTFYVEEDRGKELSLRLTEWKKTQNPKTAREKPPKDLVPPVVDFDAIFIPDSPKALGQIAPMLAYNDVNGIPLLGTNIWNTPQTIERASKFVENSVFVDEFFSNDAGPAMKKFTLEFQTLFGYKPDVFETQGFDSLAVVVKALQSGSISTRKAMRDALAATSKVPGAIGYLSVNPARDIEKNLLSLTIQKGQIVKADN